MTIKEIVKEYLTANRYDGLSCEQCCCGIDDLMGCSGLLDGAPLPDDCEPGHKSPCNPETCTADGDCEFHIKPD